MNRYEEMENFVRIVEAGSITGAAQQLRVAKSAVSRRLKEFETRIGAQLFIRSTRKLTLTDTGQALYERAIRLLADWEEVESVASASRGTLSGLLKISAPLSFGINQLGPMLLDFMKEHPEIELDIDFSDRKVDLIAEGMDLAVRIGVLEDSNLIARKFADISTVVCASPDYLANHGHPKTPDDLAGHEELAYGYRRSAINHYTDPKGNRGQIELKARLHATNGEFMRDAAIAGEGILIIPRFIVYESLNDGSLVEILEDYDWGGLGAYVLYPPTRHLSSRVRTFVDHLVEKCRGTPVWEK